MELQQIFDKVATHLLTQNAVARAYNGCAYRGENGTKCAVGCLIPDTLYDAEVEGAGVNGAFAGYNGDDFGEPRNRKLYGALIASGVDTLEKAELASDLQDVHDDTDPDMEGGPLRPWLLSLQSLAEQWRLDPRALDSFVPADMGFMVEHRLIGNRWDDAEWTIDGEPHRFATRAQAQEEINQHVAAANAANMGYDVNDYRVVIAPERN